MQVFLETERMVLRRFTAADVDHLVDLDSDPEVMRFLTGGIPTLSGIGFFGAVKQQSALVLVPDASVPVCAPADGVQKVAVVSWEP